MKLSVRMKLTLWYSAILIVTSLTYIVVTNWVVTDQFRKGPPDMDDLIQEAQSEMSDEYSISGVEQNYIPMRQIINNIRERDLEKIRLASVGIFFVLMGLSFVGGYIIAGRTLQPLYDSLQAQKQFIANASHELKTPLTIVQTNLEAAEHEMAAADGSPAEYIQQALNSTVFMNQLIEDLLVLVLPPDQVIFQAVDLSAVVSQATNRLQTLAKQSGKAINVQLPTNINSGDLAIQGNITLLERAVMNCVENAIRYAKHNITVTLVKVSSHNIITIQDDGIGIPAEAVSKVTNRFFRVDQARSRTSGGTGLGLAITKTIMERHHSQLNITSQAGAGTTVTLTL
ncbi:MAG: histidine kinase [uncultured bacterium]|nr:MAG: histidine kinase [uncultured bacterium]